MMKRTIESYENAQEMLSCSVLQKADMTLSLVGANWSIILSLLKHVFLTFVYDEPDDPAST